MATDGGTGMLEGERSVPEPGQEPGFAGSRIWESLIVGPLRRDLNGELPN